MGNGDKNALFYRVCSTPNLRCNGRFPRIRRHRTPRPPSRGEPPRPPAPIPSHLPLTIGFSVRNS
jgi:hypothetical protein